MMNMRLVGPFKVGSDDDVGSTRSDGDQAVAVAPGDGLTPSSGGPNIRLGQNLTFRAPSRDGSVGTMES